MHEPLDMRLIQRGARLRRSAYFEATQRAGCWGYTVYNHMFLPIGYDALEREYHTLLNGVTVWDVSVERNLEISGPDAFRFTSLLTPRDLSKCAVGHGRYVLLTDDEGGIINDPVLLRIEENRFWLAAADSDIVLWAKGVARGSGMKVEIRELDVAPMQVQGPKSRDVMQALFGDRVLSLSYYPFFEAQLGTIPLIVTRTGSRLDLNMNRWRVHEGNTPLGEVTSAVYSPRLGANIGYAMVPISHAANGTRFAVDTDEGERAAVVVPMPFIDPAKALAKG